MHLGLWTLTRTIHACGLHCIGDIVQCSQDPQPFYFKKYIKNESHGTIYIFKNYFATIFFSFQFSAFSCIQMDPRMIDNDRLIFFSLKNIPLTNWKHSNKTFINKFITIDSEPNDNHSCWLLKVLQNDNVTIAKKEAMSPWYLKKWYTKC